MPATLGEPCAENKNRRPSGRNHGQRCVRCCSLSVVTVVAAPPVALTRIKGPVASGANRMIPSAFHVPPPHTARVTQTNCPSRLPGNGTSVWGAPPARSSRLMALSAKNATERLSGDQNGYHAPSVPVRGCAVVDARERNQRR